MIGSIQSNPGSTAMIKPDNIKEVAERLPVEPARKSLAIKRIILPPMPIRIPTRYRLYGTRLIRVKNASKNASMCKYLVHFRIRAGNIGSGRTK
jgi:hypothetical protein